MSSLSHDDISQLAQVARIELTAAEVSDFTAQINEVLGVVSKISDLVGVDVPPTTHPVPANKPHRDDTVRNSLTLEQALSAAPEVEDGQFRVPQILGEEA